MDKRRRRVFALSTISAHFRRIPLTSSLPTAVRSCPFWICGERFLKRFFDWYFCGHSVTLTHKTKWSLRARDYASIAIEMRRKNLCRWMKKTNNKTCCERDPRWVSGSECVSTALVLKDIKGRQVEEVPYFPSGAPEGKTGGYFLTKWFWRPVCAEPSGEGE